MRELVNTEETVRFCKALSSPLRVEMLQYILAHEETSPNDLAEAFGVSRAAVTQNLRLLAEAELVNLSSYNSRASQKKACFLRDNKFVITLGEHFGADTVYQTEIPIGQYTDYQVFPTCGIATPDFLIGHLDDPRYFDSPQRTEAGILWLMKGYVEYRLPNYLKENQQAHGDKKDKCDDLQKLIHRVLHHDPPFIPVIKGQRQSCQFCRRPFTVLNKIELTWNRNQ